MNILGIARKGNYTKLREILYSQPDLVYEDVSLGCTLLHYAAMDGYSDLVELLIARGADADKKDNNNRTPLNYASYEGNFEVVKILLNTSKVNLDGIDNNGWAPVHIVAFEGYNDILKLFIEYDEMCIYARSAKQGTPLHYAANGCQVKTAQLLIENRAYVNTLDYVGKTPLDWVISRPNNKDMISLLRSYCGKMKGEINRKEGDIDFLSKFPKHVLWFVIRENLSAWEQITLLKSGIANWNSWRSRFPNVKPALYGVELSGAKLREINFANASLSPTFALFSD